MFRDPSILRGEILGKGARTRAQFISSWIIHEASVNTLHAVPTNPLKATDDTSLFDSFPSKLSGPLPTEIGLLTSLESLDLSHNQSCGEIPESFGNVTRLQSLSLSDNCFSGETSKSIGNLVHLGRLNLSHNQLSGEIPPIFMLSNLSSLQLNNNNLVGPFHQNLGSVFQLTWIDASHNQLTGSLQNSIFPRGLRSLKLSHNQLSGPLLKLEALERILSGPLPASMFRSMKRIKMLDLSSNQFSGLIPESLESQWPLEMLDLSGSHFEGDLPDHFRTRWNKSVIPFRWQKCVELKSRTFIFVTTVPREIKAEEFGTCAPTQSANDIKSTYNVRHMKMLQIPNKLQAQIFHLLHPFETVKYCLYIAPSTTRRRALTFRRLLLLSTTRLSRFVLFRQHAGLSQRNSLRESTLRCARVPAMAFSQIMFNRFRLPHVKTFRRIHNKVAMLAKYPSIRNRGRKNITRGRKVVRFVGPLPDTMDGMRHLAVLALLQSVPTRICDMVKFTVLDLEFKNLTGSVVSVLGNLVKLKKLNLRRSMLTGSIPTSLRMLVHLIEFKACMNACEQSLVNCDELTTLDLSGNAREGHLPGRFRNDLLPESSEKWKWATQRESFVGKISHLKQSSTTTEAHASARLTHRSAGANLSASSTRSRLQSIGESAAPTIATDSPEDIFFGKDFLRRVLTETARAFEYEAFHQFPLTTLKVVPINPRKSNNATSILEWFPSEVNGPMKTFHLTGPLPNTVGCLKQLTSLDFGWSSGTDMLRSLCGTQGANLMGQTVTGPIPSELGNLVTLKNLNFSDTNLEGTMPDSLGNLVNLEVLDMSNTRLSGCIPASFGNLVNLVDLRLQNNELSGKLPDMFGRMTKLQTLSLSSNHFEGPIPESIGRCIQLKTLHCEQNQFSGAIPDSIFRLPLLQSAKFDRNSIISKNPPVSSIVSLDSDRITGITS
ncbi:hypothetical protein BJ741DRAFT_670506 [Chytriomyces cf. hyalinus JEL632]|nr:hypothetical protein BJ741DRAFT_670506 [Chytriomyces cf. hyalinus JEL632]